MEWGKIMQLSQLEYFIKVAECGSITKASQELYMSQPSLTKAISNLETEYKVQLFKRTPKGIVMTEKGREFLDYARNTLAAADALEHTFRIGGEVQERLHVVSQQLDFLYQIISDVYREAGGTSVYVDLEETDQGMIVDRISRREADLGLLVISEEDSRNFKQRLREKGLEIHVLDTSHVYVSMAKSCPYYGQEHISISESTWCPHVVLDTEQIMRQKLRLEKRDGNFDYSHLIFCNSIAACLHFMRTIGALLYTPKWVLGMLEAPDIHTVLLNKDDGTLYPAVNTLVWIKRAHEALSPLEEAFIIRLNEYFLDAPKI